jgi:RHH-type proline utilization regulon transcriptional repressor/proline dehydrogenase/delta 1-pyrroline-5-carboxylate dehydrogenase
MSWAMQDERVKAQMFRFVDVLPMLDTSQAVVEHLHEYLGTVSGALPRAARLGLSLAPPNTLAGRALALAARRNVLGQARRFIAGATVHETLAAAMRERKQRRGFTLDLLGEAVTSDEEADRYQQAYLSLLSEAAPVVAAWPEVPQVDRGLFAPVPRLNVSLKLTALDPRFSGQDPAGAIRHVGSRLRPLLRAASEQGAFVNVDMESYDKKSATLAVFQSILDEAEFRGVTDVGIVTQAYLRDSEADLRQLCAWADRRGAPVWVRLVKGAYWDYETIHARSVGWPVPVFEDKRETDANFERLTELLILNHQTLRPAIASHNVRSLAHAIAVARQIGLPTGGLELQMLYGMADPIKQALYMPFGELIPGMAYLVRRLLENTSNDSFLRASFLEDAPPEELLMNPLEPHRPASPPAQFPAHPPAPSAPPRPPLTQFKNEPPVDFAIPTERDALLAALAAARAGFGRRYPLVIGGERVDTADRLISRDPSRTATVIGTTASATAADADRAVACARAALPAWSALGVHDRAEHLRAAARQMRRRRSELTAWIIYESGKGWIEADADVAEAIDFCEYYALGAEWMAAPPHIDAPGEENRLEYLPRGVAAIIAPWNFPLAILTGMTAAALVTGNTAIMKPAEQTSIIAAKLMEIWEEAQIPPGVVNYLPGRGEVVGARLVEHPQVALIAFTGSREVGLAINRRAAEVSGAGAPVVKHVIAEMGGKNAIIIDDDADLDEAVLGVLKSAFGYQGQKCSACSRAVVLHGVYDAFVIRLVGAARSLELGPADQPGTDVGPVIDQEALDRIERYIGIARGEGQELLATSAGPWREQGYYVGPHIYGDLEPASRTCQEEIFGPLLALQRARDFDHALELANGTQYALTGGVFSRSPARLARARRELVVGNLYLNRSITGALVGRQPFGGFKMSGIGTKAGGTDYLLQFVVPRTVTENTMRRGFVTPSTDGDA